jgi:hypothetical protein
MINAQQVGQNGYLNLLSVFLWIASSVYILRDAWFTHYTPINIILLFALQILLQLHNKWKNMGVYLPKL